MTAQYEQMAAAGAMAALVPLLIGSLWGGFRARVRRAGASLLATAATRAAAAAVRYGGVDAADLPVVRAIARDRVVDETADGLLLLSDDGTVVDCTQGAAAVLGVDRKTVLGDPLASRAADVAEAAGLTDATGGGGEAADDDGAVDADPKPGCDAAYGGGGIVDGAPGVTRMTDEGRRHYEVRVAPVTERGAGVRAVVIRDVTQCRRLRRRVGVLNRLLRHDLRNEMNVVVVYAELLESSLGADDPGGGGSSADRDGERSMEADLAAVERITGAAEAMLDRAETVRHVEATLDAGGSTRTRLDVAALVRTLVDGVEYPHATVSVEGPDAAWITATGLLDTVFYNLLENAVSHNHREQPSVDVTITAADGYVAVTVADDGPGIPQQELATFRAAAKPPPRTRRDSGCGSSSGSPRSPGAAFLSRSTRPGRR
jgi:PAS domain-containing protein